MLDDSKETFRQGVRDMVRELQLSDAQRAGTATAVEQDELVTLRQKRIAEAQWEHGIFRALTGSATPLND